MEVLRIVALVITLVLAGCGFRYLPGPELPGPVLAEQAIKAEHWLALSPEVGYQLNLELGYEDPSSERGRFVPWQVFSLHRLHPLSGALQKPAQNLSDYQRDSRFSLRGRWQIDEQSCHLVLFKVGNERVLTLARQANVEHGKDDADQVLFVVQQASLPELEGLVFRGPKNSIICKTKKG